LYSSSFRAIEEILTVGHSTHTFDRFARLLELNGVRQIVDVRKVPKSGRMPWFRGDALAESLPRVGVAYAHEPRLGGFRRPRRDTPNAGWLVEAFRGYADHMDSDDFRAGLATVESLARARRTAVMCAEAQWTRCHRRLVADALVVRDWTVLHIDSNGGTRPHSLTEFAVVVGKELLQYPPQQGALDV
jgi:uncharacterized protein (DUF488 family)